MLDGRVVKQVKHSLETHNDADSTLATGFDHELHHVKAWSQKEVPFKRTRQIADELESRRSWSQNEALMQDKLELAQQASQALLKRKWWVNERVAFACMA